MMYKNVPITKVKKNFFDKLALHKIKTFILRYQDRKHTSHRMGEYINIAYNIMMVSYQEYMKNSSNQQEKDNQPKIKMSKRKALLIKKVSSWPISLWKVGQHHYIPGKLKPSMSYPYIPTRVAKIKKSKITNIGKDIEQLELSNIVDGLSAILENCLARPLNFNIYLPWELAVPLLDIYQREIFGIYACTN